MRRLAVLLFSLVAWLALSAPLAAQDAAGEVLVATFRGPVTPISADVLVEAVAEAERSGAALLLVEIDTPGGLDDSMREIVQAFLGARVPVVAYVAPSGARAASAGMFVSMSAHIAAMAPGTTIGAATPVDLQGGDLSEKILNDAAAYAEAIAEVRERNVEFALDAVRDGRSITAEDAVEIGAVDLLASSRGELLDRIDGREVTLADGTTVTLDTEALSLVELELSWLQRLLLTVADPNLAFLFISLGTLAILYEIANPGLGLGAIAGVILLVLGFTALAVLPVNLAGVVLLLLAIGLLVAELFVPGVGVLAAGGTIALLVAGLFLFQRPSGVAVDLVVLLPTVVLAGTGALAIAVMATRLRSRPALIGERALVGRRAEVRHVQGERAQVFTDGTLWAARSPGHRLKQGQSVRVVDQVGLELTVEPEEESD